jgi:hypothetical protein
MISKSLTLRLEHLESRFEPVGEFVGKDLKSCKSNADDDRATPERCWLASATMATESLPILTPSITPVSRAFDGRTHGTFRVGDDPLAVPDKPYSRQGRSIDSAREAVPAEPSMNCPRVSMGTTSLSAYSAASPTSKANPLSTSSLPELPPAGPRSWVPQTAFPAYCSDLRTKTERKRGHWLACA